MGKYPVLKPQEVAAILEKLGFVLIRQHVNEDPTGNTGHLMVEILLYRFIRDEISHQFF